MSQDLSSTEQASRLQQHLAKAIPFLKHAMVSAQHGELDMKLELVGDLLVVTVNGKGAFGHDMHLIEEKAISGGTIG